MAHSQSDNDRSIPKELYKLPRTFSSIIHQKLISKQPLDMTEYNKLVRDMQASILEHTIKPDTESLKFVINKLITKYPHLLDNPENPEGTIVSFLSFFKIL